MSIIKHVTSQKIVAHDFRYDPRTLCSATDLNSFMCLKWITECKRLVTYGLGDYMNLYLGQRAELLGRTSFPPSRQHNSTPHAIINFREKGEIHR